MAKRIVDEEMRFSIVINGNEAQKELYELEKSTRNLTQENKSLRAEKVKLKAQGKQDSAEYKNLTARIKENNSALTANKARTSALQKELGITGLTMRQLSQRSSQLKLQLANMIPGSAQYKRLQVELKATDARMAELRISARATRVSIGSVADGFNRYFAMGASIIAAGTGVALSIQKMIDYNGKLSDSQADVQKTTGLTKEGVDELTKSFGLFKTRTARIELLKLAEDAGRLGITGVKNLQDFVGVANQLKVALGDDLSDEAIKEVGKMTNVYKVGEKVNKDFAGSMLALGSAINEVSASGANQAGFLVDYLKRQAGIAVQAKVGAAENIGYAATFDEIGQSVEVSATAMNKVWMDMFSNTDVYAKIAGMSLKDFNNILLTDSNEAMILFLEGLNGNNEGLEVMVKKLEDLEAGGARGAQALSALAGNTQLLRERQQLANKSLQEATSLTNEYDVKNNNLAATIDKVKKTMMGWFANGTVVSGLQSFINGFAKLIGATENLNKVFEEQTQVTYATAKANIAAANSSSKLLDEYEELTRDGLEPTEEAKRRLEEITILLRDRLGESVVAIDKETGALKLNTEAVREQIKMKRLSADEEASALVSRLKGTDEEKKRLSQDIPALQKEYEIRQRIANDAREQFKASAEYQRMSQRGRLGAVSRLDEVKAEQEAFRALTGQQGLLAEQEKRRLDILEKLNELNYNEADVNLMFPDNEEGDAGPKEGDTQVIEGQLFKFSGGKWVAMKTPTGPGGSDPKNAASDLKRRQQELRRLEEENNKLRASLIDDAFQQELAVEDANHQARIARLKEQQTTEAELKGLSPAARSIAIQQNKELNTQIELEEEIHQNKIGAILQRGIQAQIAKEQEAFDREAKQRETAHNLEIAALGNNREARKRLQEQYDREEEARQHAHLEKMIARMKEILQSANFEGVNLDLLPPAEKQKILDWLDDANLKLSELLNKMGSGGTSIDGARIDGDVDVLGFSIDQWTQTFENLDTTASKLDAAQMAVGALMNTWGMFSDFQRKRQEVEMRNFEKAQDKQQRDLKRNLDSGYINQRQYDKAVEEMDRERRKKQAEMEYKQAKREKEMAVSSIALNGTIAIAKALAQGGFVLGIPWSGIIAGMVALQLGMALKTPLPAKGYEDGLYPVQREQDGALFNASYGGQTRSGLVSKPTLFMAGERNKPEMVIDNNSWRKMDPEVKNSIYRELGRMGRVPGFEGGYYPELRRGESSGQDTGGSQDYALFAAALNRNSSVMEKIEQSGIPAFLVRNMENAKKMQDDIQDYNKLRNANKR